MIIDLSITNRQIILADSVAEMMQDMKNSSCTMIMFAVVPWAPVSNMQNIVHQYQNDKKHLFWNPRSLEESDQKIAIEAVAQGLIVNTPVQATAMRQASQTFDGRSYYSVDSAAVLDETFDMQAAFAYQKVQVDLLL